MFTQQGYGVVGVQNESSGGGRSVVLSYTLADLVDGESSRNQVLQDVVDFFGISATITDAETYELPASLTLATIYPNPFSQSATVSFELPKSSAVRLELYNTLGRRTSVLLDNEVMSAGLHEVSLNGSHLPSGMYFVSLISGNHIERKPVIIVR